MCDQVRGPGLPGRPRPQHAEESPGPVQEPPLPGHHGGLSRREVRVWLEPGGQLLVQQSSDGEDIEGEGHQERQQQTHHGAAGHDGLSEDS